MLEFALDFFQNHQRRFYALITIAVILEGPIVILTLTSLSESLEIPLFIIFLFAIIGDTGGDILHFFVGRYGKKILNLLPFKIKNQHFLKIRKTIEDYPLLEKLIIIKYTPPITSAGLFYLGATSLSFKTFFLTTLPLCLISSSLVFGIGVFFSHYIINQDHIVWMFLGLGISLFIVLKLFKYCGKRLVQYITIKHQKADFSKKLSAHK